MLKIKQSEFVTSATCLKEAPVLHLPEFIMIGRSNVGKSSFINALCNRKNLAYIGKSPGKTRLINLYKINEAFVLTDLPGYGFARRSKTEQEQWQKKIEEYLRNRKEIVSGIQIMDARHEPQKNDIQMREWLVYYNIDTITVLTKIDHVSKNKISSVLATFEKEFGSPIIGFSAKTKYGKDDMLKMIELKIKKQ
jgi:GTP-binding protein